MREWVGGGLKALGEMCEREEETEEGELKMVVAEVVVSTLSVPSFFDAVLITSIAARTTRVSVAH